MNGTEVFNLKVAVRHRDGYACTKCGMTAEAHLERYGRTLDVHRLDPGSEYTLDGCVTLCRSCHGPEPRLPRRSVNRRGVLPKAYRDMLRTVAALRAEMGEPFDAAAFVAELLRPIRRLHEETVETYTAWRPPPK